MNCCIYRSRKKIGSYLYLPEKNNFNQVPETLLKLFGHPEFSFEFELTPEKGLANADAAEVLEQLKTQGFFLQLPPKDEEVDADSVD